MPGHVEGKVALVTGAGRGQGRAHAVRLAEEGADIIAVDACTPIETVPYAMSGPDDLAETVRLVEALDRRIVGVQADVRDGDALREGVRKGVTELDRIDTVVANAGILTLGRSFEQTEEQWQTMIDVNLSGVWRTVSAAVPVVISQKSGGSVIITSSLLGLKGATGAASYAAAKWGVVGLARSLAHELAPYEIRVNTVHPTNVRTKMLENPQMWRAFRPDLEAPSFEDVAPYLSSLNIWRRPWVQPEDVANAVLWLASDESRFVTGISLPVDLGASSK